mmetsp:Transcript_6472/g.14909  ORF Transcript_6472/g.14909 Transcript_6472/m.14909 type:complete len:369 (+) Transcript_6472:923-2029(+)
MLPGWFRVRPLADMLFRLVWLLCINCALVELPPVISIMVETGASYSEIPHVTKWNPLVNTTHWICGLSLLSVFVWGAYDCYSAFGPSDVEEGITKPQDMYQDPSNHLLGCTCIFLLMTLLLSIYLQLVLKLMEMDPKRTGLWLGALLVQIKITMGDRTLQEDLFYYAPTKSSGSWQAVVNFTKGLGSAVNGVAEGSSGEGNEIFTASDAESADAFYSTPARQRQTKQRFQWLRWACCMATPQNQPIWAMHLSANQLGRSLWSKPECEHDPDVHEVDRIEPWQMPEIMIRFLMSYLSNGFYRTILVYTLPLWLCRGSLADFVLNAFATVYIVELDDAPGDATEWRLETCENRATTSVSDAKRQPYLIEL